MREDKPSPSPSLSPPKVYSIRALLSHCRRRRRRRRRHCLRRRLTVFAPTSVLCSGPERQVGVRQQQRNETVETGENKTKSSRSDDDNEFGFQDNKFKSSSLPSLSSSSSSLLTSSCRRRCRRCHRSCRRSASNVS